MTTRIAINGFGRIGRMVFRRAIVDKDMEIVAINASYPAETIAHLINYDSVHGRFSTEVKALSDGLLINGKKVFLVSNRTPSELPWRQLGIDLVIEATGKFKTKEAAGQHLDAGAKQVIITAPGKSVDATIVMGVNQTDFQPEKHQVISAASCTTNCLAPLLKVLHHEFGVEHGLLTTVHAFTNDQQSLDNPHKDLRRARGCTQSIIPTSTGAAEAIKEVMPSLEGKLKGMALRVPTPNVSLVDLTVELKKTATPDKVNECFRRASEKEMKGIIQYSDQPLVSIDYTTSDFSAVVDGLSTMVVADNNLKIIAWYDNEWGYACRVVDLARFISYGSVKQEQYQYS